MILGFFSDMGKFFSDNPWYLVIVIAVLIIAIAVAFAISGLKKKGEKSRKRKAKRLPPRTSRRRNPLRKRPPARKGRARSGGEGSGERGGGSACGGSARGGREECGTAGNRKPADAPADAEEKTEKNYAEENIYHVTRRKEDGKWQVKLQKGDKAIKLFNTQEEAYAYAKKIAGNKEGTVHLHKVSGQIRKYK